MEFSVVKSDILQELFNEGRLSFILESISLANFNNFLVIFKASLGAARKLVSIGLN